MPSAAAKLPAVQLTGAVEPATQNEPAGHSVHSAAPGDEAYEPAAQSVHTLLLAAAYSPAAHCSAAVAAVGHAEPAGQLLQPACDARSVAALKLPASHGRATLAPPVQWWPAKHAAHAVAPSAST